MNKEPQPDAKDLWYVQMGSTKLTKDKAPTSEVVTTLDRGQSVILLEKCRSRFRVQVTNGPSGWVSKTRISENPPSASPETQPCLEDLAKLSDVTVEEARSGGSIRG